MKFPSFLAASAAVLGMVVVDARSTTSTPATNSGINVQRSYVKSGQYNKKALMAKARPYKEAARRKLEDEAAEDDADDVDEEEAEEEQMKDNLAMYSLQFNTCISLNVLDDDMANGDNDEDGASMMTYLKKGYVSSQKSYVIFNICKYDECYYEPDNDDNTYIVDLNTYIESLSSYTPTIQSQYCEQCEEQQDYCLNGGNNNYYNGYMYRGSNITTQDGEYYEIIDCGQCFNYGCFNEYQQQNNGNNNGEDQQEIGYEEASEFIETISGCMELNEGGNNGNDNNNGNSWKNLPLYAGYTCSSDGTGIDIGIFVDDQCMYHSNKHTFSADEHLADQEEEEEEEDEADDEADAADYEYDANGGYYDEYGNYHDANGAYYDVNGYYHDGNGGYYDQEGNYYQENGNNQDGNNYYANNYANNQYQGPSELQQMYYIASDLITQIVDETIPCIQSNVEYISPYEAYELQQEYEEQQNEYYQELYEQGQYYYDNNGNIVFYDNDENDEADDQDDAEEDVEYEAGEWCENLIEEIRNLDNCADEDGNDNDDNNNNNDNDNADANYDMSWFSYDITSDGVEDIYEVCDVVQNMHGEYVKEYGYDGDGVYGVNQAKPKRDSVANRVKNWRKEILPKPWMVIFVIVAVLAFFGGFVAAAQRNSFSPYSSKKQPLIDGKTKETAEDDDV